jgi:hypothetical protein
LLRKTLLITWLLVTAMSLVSVGAVSAETTLKDFNGHWAASTISKWIDQGLIKGYEDNTIRPDNLVNRAEFVSMVNRAWGISNDGYSSVFQDVAKDQWYYSDIAAAYNLGYISGSSPETFEPDSTITREQAAVMIAQLLTLEANSEDNILSELEDYEQLADWSKPYVETVFAQGILNGYVEPGGTRGTVLAVRIWLCRYAFNIICLLIPVSLANCLVDSPFSFNAFK